MTKVKKSSFLRFDTTPACDRQTDRRTDTLRSLLPALAKIKKKWWWHYCSILPKCRLLQKFCHHFLFLQFSMCNCAVNWCDKLFFCIYICVLLPIFNFCHMTRWGSKQSHNHRAYIVTFHFYLCGRWNLITNWYQSWPLGSRKVMILTIQGHATSSFTWPFNS